MTKHARAYKTDKRRKELARRKKKEDKMQRRITKGTDAPLGTEQPEEGSITSQEAGGEEESITSREAGGEEESITSREASGEKGQG